MARIKTDRLPCSACGGAGKVDRINAGSLRAVREAHGITLRSMAEAMDLSPAYLSDVELGQRNVTERVLSEYRKLEGKR